MQSIGLSNPAIGTEERSEADDVEIQNYTQDHINMLNSRTTNTVFETKPKSASHNTIAMKYAVHSQSGNIRQTSLNLNKSGLKSLNIQDNYSGSLATAAERETNGDSSNALI